MIRILLVDDQNLIQEGIKALLDQHTELKVIGTVKDGRSAIKLVGLLHPDIVLLDIEMPEMDGITVTKHITRIAPETKVIILTSYEDKKYVMQSLLAGARGYILKSSLMKDLKQAILAVDSGYCQLESRLLAKIFNSDSIKSKKSNSLSISEIEESNRGEEYSTSNKNFIENKLSESEESPSDNKQNNFLDGENSEQSLLNSIDVSTESKNNEFVSPNFSTISSSMHSVLVTSEIKPVETFNTLFIPPTKPIETSETSETFETPPTTQPIETSEISDTSSQTQSIETSKISATSFTTQPIATSEISDTLPQTQLTETSESSTTSFPIQPPQTQSTETSEIFDTPPQTQPIVTSETSETSPTTEQENIQNSQVPLLPVVNQMALSMASECSSSSQDVVENRKSNKLVAKTFALKNYFRQLVSKKNRSRYKTNISIVIFRYRLVLRQYQGKILQYTKLQISQYNQRSYKYKIKLTQYKSKLLSLIKYWHEQKIFLNIGLMILGAVIFFLIHSFFNR
jgi:DNA-binding NarL/FixJ family response regulator